MLFLFIRLRHLKALAVGVAVAGLLQLVGASEWLAGPSPVQAAPGPPREVQLASLYERPPSAADELAVTARLKDQEGYWSGVRDEEILAQIRTRPLKKISFNRGGSSLSFRLEMTGGWGAAFKPDQVHEQTVPRKEVAAYRINRLLGLSRVPPATCRVLSLKDLYTYMDPEQRHLFYRIQKEAKFQKGWSLAGEASYWLPQIGYLPIDQWKLRKRWIEWLKAYKTLPPRHAPLTAQISVMLIFDFLINNPDRFSGHNTMTTPDAKFLYFMDNTYSFHLFPRGGKATRHGLFRVMRFSRDFYQRLKALDAKKLRAALAAERHCPWPLLTDDEIGAVIARRDYAVQYINSMVARYGWERTMVFP